MRYLHEVTVKAERAEPFPVDMLRREMLAPKSAQDVTAITAAIAGEEAECFGACPKLWPAITLVREGPHEWSPSRHWRAFGWAIMNHEAIAIDQRIGPMIRLNQGERRKEA